MVFQGMGYDKPSLFVYSVVVRDSVGNTSEIDTLGLFCSDVRFRGKQNLMQWQALRKMGSGYSLDSAKYREVYMGVSIDDTELFIHPPRELFRVLQFVPYPAIENNRSIGDTWSYDFPIGSIWREDEFFPVDSVETFHLSYKLVGDTVLNSMDSLTDTCYKIEAKSRSRFGVSEATYFLNVRKGLVYYRVNALGKVFFEFSLIDKQIGIEHIMFNKTFTGFVIEDRRAFKPYKFR